MAPGDVLVESDWTLVFVFWLRKNSEPRQTIRESLFKVTEVEVRCRRKGLRKQVTEAKEGSLEIRRKREVRKCAWRKRVGERGGERLECAP